MLFQVEMNVWLPHDLPAEKAESVLAQRAGAWRHLWRVGRYANGSIVDPQEQNGSLSSLPLFPFHSVVTLHVSTTIIDRFRIN